MSEKHKKHQIFLSVADPSADSHCAGLISALQQMDYDIDFVGVGGPKMAAAGCDLLEYTVSKSAMMYKSFVHVAHFYKLLRRVTSFLYSSKTDLVIVCDSPSFNFHVAKTAKKAGIKTLFYVAPQIWAWAGWRIQKLRRRCDKLCCILPFEQDWFSQRGIDTTFVGNPLLDKLTDDLSNYKKGYANFDPNRLKLAIMPGSRSAEIESLWRPMQEIALWIKKKYPEASFFTVAVDSEREKILKNEQIADFECQYIVGNVIKIARSVDFALVASGSATLEVAAAGCPMIVMYQSSRILWYLVGWWLVRPKYFSLVNLLADKELVPEFMPYFSSIEPIVRTIEKLLEDKNKLTRMSIELIETVKPLTSKKANDEVAKIIVEMLW